MVKPKRTAPKRLRRGTTNKNNPNWDLRYGTQKSYKKNCAIAHNKTRSLCCVCLVNKSNQIHHAYYGNDVAGESVFPVCTKCHRLTCHSKKYWIKDSKNPVWENRNTETFLQRLRMGYKLLNKGLTPSR